MSPRRSEDLGPHNEWTEGFEKSRTTVWFATHRLVCTRRGCDAETLEVMAWDRGADAPGPGRYALYTRDNANGESEPEWTMDSAGQVWYRNEALPDDLVATVEDVWV
jgi:hypothetical protein